MNESAALSDVRTTDGTGLSEVADTSGFLLLDYSGVVYICAAGILQRFLLILIYFLNFEPYYAMSMCFCLCLT